MEQEGNNETNSLNDLDCSPNIEFDSLRLEHFHQRLVIVHRLPNSSLKSYGFKAVVKANLSGCSQCTIYTG